MTGPTVALLGATGVIGYLAGLALHLPWLRLASKPLPVLGLALALLGAPPSFYRRTIGFGLLLSLLGDVLLEFPGLFVAGLASFLAAHVAYAAAFLHEEHRLRLLRLLPFLIWILAAGAVLWPRLGPMRLPVALYMAAIAAMMWRAAARAGETPGAGAAALGAVLFGLSDTLIAFDRFHDPIAGVGYPIILLYWAGQAGIAASARDRPA